MYVIRLPYQNINSGWTTSISWKVNDNDFFRYLKRNRSDVHSLRLLALIENIGYFKEALDGYRPLEFHRYIKRTIERLDLNLYSNQLKNCPKEFIFITEKLREIIKVEQYSEKIEGALKSIYENIEVVGTDNILINDNDKPRGA